MRLGLPVHPWRGFRRNDSAGSGGFGASRDGGKRWHLGRDFIALPGDTALCPIDGKVERLVLAYPDGLLHGYVVEGKGQHEGMRVKVLYVKPEINPGQVVTVGTVMGVVEDVAAYYAAKGVTITPHIHVETWGAMNPDSLFGPLKDPADDATVVT